MENKFDELIERRNTNSAKFDEADLMFGSDVMHLGVADMDFRSPEPIIHAMKEIVDKGVFGYTILPQDYKDLVCKWMNRRYSVEVEKDWVVFSPRINMAMNMVVETFTDPGDGIILHTPAYTALQNAVEKYDRTMIESPLKLVGEKYKMDFEELRRSIQICKKELEEKGKKLRLMLLCNPHNPTGRVWTRSELMEVIEICEENDLILLSDEIHADFVKQGNKFCSVLGLGEKFKNRIIVCNSITKTFNVPGVILSNILIPDSGIREKIESTIDRWGLHNPNIFAAGILKAAYTQCDNWIDEVNTYIEENYRYLANYLKSYMPEFRLIPSEGTYMAWIDIVDFGISSKEMESFFINKAKVSVYMGNRYGQHTDSFIRINIATSRAYLHEALERIRQNYDCLKHNKIRE